MVGVKDIYNQWLQENLKIYFRFVRVMKKKEAGEIILYQHKSSQKYYVLRKLKGFYPVYQRMVELRHKNLSVVCEVVSNNIETMILEEYVQGVPVSFLLERQPFTLETMKRAVIQVCDGLYALHSNDIIHRDIKPENIMIADDGSVKIIDFDIAKVYKSYENKDTITLGTIGYAAPEQYGEAQSDEKTDIYALGVLMNVMLTGKHPVNQLAEGRVGKIIQKCIMVVPLKRYQSVLQIKEILQGLL